MTRVVRFHEIGGPEVLQIEDVDVPAPKPGEVRIAVKAIGLNRAEVMYRTGQYLSAPRFPASNGYEAAGTVESVGPGVTGFAPGDAVSVIPAFNLVDYGTYGELVNLPVHAVTHHPASLSWADAAASWMMYATAYGALIDIAGLQAGETVLVRAASSSVGIAAIQIARMRGAVPIALTRGSGKREALLKHGAAHVIATAEQDLVAEVQRITDGRGARIVFDPVGGPEVTRILEVMAPQGIFFQYGALDLSPLSIPVFPLLAKHLSVRGYTLFEITSDPKRLERAKSFIVDGLASGHLKPVIARTFTLDQIVDAHRFMESNEQIGKIVVTV